MYIHGMARIVVKLRNSDDKILAKRTIQVRGKFRFQLIAAAKVLQIISGYREVYGEHIKRATIELINISDCDVFVSLVKKYSPVPIEFVVFAEVKHIV